MKFQNKLPIITSLFMVGVLTFSSVAFAHSWNGNSDNRWRGSSHGGREDDNGVDNRSNQSHDREVGSDDRRWFGNAFGNNGHRGRNSDTVRINFLVRMVTRLERVKMNIERSRMRQEQKDRLITRIDALIADAESAIDDLGGNGGTADNNAPSITSLTLSGITSSWATLSFNSNESGTGYWVILSSNLTSPGTNRVMLWQDAGWLAASVRGSGAFSTGSNQYAISGLSASGSYTLYFVWVDTAGNKTRLMSLNFSTPPASTADVTAPTITSLTIVPSTTTGALQFTSNESGTGYWVVVSSGATAPTSSQIRLGQDATGLTANVRGSGAIASGTNSFMVTGLTPGVAYALHFVAVDSSGNVANTISTTFQTWQLDTAAPNITSLSLTGITSTGATLSLFSSESGTGYWVVVSSGATAPTSSQIRLGQDATGLTANVRGSGAIASGMSTLPITGLSASTPYILHFVASDAFGNLETVVHTLWFSSWQ